MIDVEWNNRIAILESFVESNLGISYVFACLHENIIMWESYFSKNCVYNNIMFVIIKEILEKVREGIIPQLKLRRYNGTCVVIRQNSIFHSLKRRWSLIKICLLEANPRILLENRR